MNKLVILALLGAIVSATHESRQGLLEKAKMADDLENRTNLVQKNKKSKKLGKLHKKDTTLIATSVGDLQNGIVTN